MTDQQLCDARQLAPEALDACLEAVAAASAAEKPVEAQYTSDPHGEVEAFDHLLRSASGETRRLVGRACPELGEREVDEVCLALYYPLEPGAPCGAAFDRERLAALAADVRASRTGRLHVVGDMWDRGARGDLVMDALMACPDADVQWGNHDVCWMGAAAGDLQCIATCVRNNVKYGNVAQFEEGYSIPLDGLFSFAERTYRADEALTPAMRAISAILFKAEAQAVLRHPEWGMGDRLLWGVMDPVGRTVAIPAGTFPLESGDFPTFDAADPFAFSDGEREVVEALRESFTASSRLREQVQWLYDHGSVYASDGRDLLFHGCVPMTGEGGFAPFDCGDALRGGRDLLDWTDEVCRRAWEGRATSDLDWMGYLWGGWQSTFAGRVVKTFERTYIADKETWKEPEDPYYELCGSDDPGVCEAILAEFGCDAPDAVIVNGHTPVKFPRGQKAVRAGGRRIVVDGGLCRAYRKSTGIAGLTLVRGPEGLVLVSHGEFCGKEEALRTGCDVAHDAEGVA